MGSKSHSKQNCIPDGTAAFGYVSSRMCCWGKLDTLDSVCLGSSGYEKIFDLNYFFEPFFTWMTLEETFQLHVHVCVCMCTCVHIYIYGYGCVHAYIHVYVMCMYMVSYIYTRLHTYIYRADVSKCVCKYVYAYVYIFSS